MPSSRPTTPATNGTTSPRKVASPPSRKATPATTPAPPPPPPLSPYQLDVPKLHSLPSEQQSLYLLTFTSDLANRVESLSGDAVNEEQASVKKELLQIINLTQPAPTRVIRNNLNRCFVTILTRGNRKPLYESINDLVALLNTGKEKAVDQRTKHAAVSCLGTIFETAGDSAISLSPLACTAILKVLKGGSNETAFRAAIFTALGRITTGINVPVDEELGRTIFKLARKAAESDRSLLVQQISCYCLEQLVRCTSYFDNSNDFDKLSGTLFKAMDNSCVAVRHAAASCLAAELVKSYSDSPIAEAVPKLRKPKKSKKATPQDDEFGLPERSSSPVPDKPATALSYNLQDLLRVLFVAYCRGGTSNRARAGIAVCYIKTLRSLGESIVEANYSTIARHFFYDILAHPGWGYANKYRLFISRKFVRVILERTVGKMLGESAQLNACRFLLNDIIKDYPQAVKERPEPGKEILTGALSALTSLMKDLGAAAVAIADIARDGLLQVLQHPSYTVQVHASRALRTFALACPQHLLLTVTVCMNSVSRELNQLNGQRPGLRRCLGYAHGLAAVLSTSSRHPLFGSVDVYARVLQQATSLLKSSGSSDLRISACQLQVAWIMIGGLMSLGANFVKIHLNQLMLLWKNALPKPFSRDQIAQRSMLELSYLSHVRECAMGSIRAFLAHNQRLLTSDISSRLSIMLENTASFLQSLPDKKTSEDLSTRLSASLQLQDYEVMVRRRLYQCFCQLLTLSPAGSIESIAQSTVLPLAVASFSDVEYNAPSSLSASIASAAANFESVWEVGDNYGFGVTSLLCGLDVTTPIDRKVQRHWTTRDDGKIDDIDLTIRTPINASAEQDGMSCYLATSTSDEADQLPNPALTEAVNSAIAIFGLCLPLQTLKVQESILEQVQASLGSSALLKDGARKSAVTANISLAMMSACRVASGEVGAVRGKMRDEAIEKAMQTVLHVCLKDPDEIARQLAAGAIGRLCLSAGNAFTASEVTYLTDTIVSNREPHVRAGCAVALANIHSQLGGMAAGFHMQSIVRLLMSLAADTHPLVHFWAVDSLAHVADSAGLNFSGYVTSTIGLLSQLYVSDNHNPECTSLASSNMSMSLPVSAAVARALDAVINVLGPDLQDMAKARDLIMSLVKLFSTERSEVGILLESLRCMEHLSLYAPGLVGFSDYVQLLQSYIDHNNLEISHAALHGLFTVMRRDADEVVQTARPGLEERLWDYLNADPSQSQIRNIFLDWLQQTGPRDPAGWILRCNTILTKTKPKAADPQRPGTATAKDTAASDPDLQDEEVAGFAAAAGVHKEDDADAAPSSTQELMRWQVRLFAMDCLHSLIAMIAKVAAVSTEESPGEQALQGRVADIVRIAFSASTAGVPALRVIGLSIIEQILHMFGRSPDPDFPEAMLLEQYQAQISSALTPAFSADSSPEMAAEAVNVCATFIATGIVTDTDRMGRILKLLVSALDSFSRDQETAAIGDLKGLSSNAQVMVRIAVFSAWAELQIASGEQRYLVDVVKPHIAQLVPLWLTSLREYSKLRFEPDISQATTGTMPPTDGDLNTTYSALNRQTLLKFYQDSWLSLVDAIASLIDEDSGFVFDALDDKHVQLSEGKDDHAENGINGIVRKQSGINYREEPVAFFFVLFGLAFESLAVRSIDDDVVTRQRNLDILQALKKILRPSVSGNAVYQEVIFAETMDLLDRMVLLESFSVQSVIVEIARNLCLAHPSSVQESQSPVNGETLSDDIEQLFELTRIIVLVLAGLVPGIADAPVLERLETSEEAVGLVRTSLQALVDVADVFPAIIKTDLHATILHIFVTILGTGACQAAVVPQALPIFRRFVASIFGEGRADTRDQLRGALGRMEIILRNAQKREIAGSVACEKNTLLAITILLSVASTHLPDTDPLVARFAVEVGECLEVPATSRVAAGCVRTLLSMNIASQTLLQSTIKFLLMPSELEGVEESKTLVAQTLSIYAARTAPEQRPAAMALVMNALLGRATMDGSKTHQESAARLLELASADNVTFRAVLASLGREQKQLLESVLKSSANARRRSREYENEQPSIALKMDFGG